MGQIRKHTIFSSLIIYFGFLIGAFNILVLFPRFIPVEYFGLTKVIQDYSIALTAIASLGFIAPFFRFSPHYEKYTIAARNDLLQLYLIVVHIGMLVVLVVSIFLKDAVTGYFNVRSPLFSTYYYSTLIFGYLLLIYNMLEMYLFSKGEAIIQSFVREIVIRLIIFILVVAVILGFSMEQFVTLFSFHYLLPIVLLGWYIKRKFPSPIGLRLSKTTRRLFPFIFSMAGIGIIQSIVTTGIPVIDTLVLGGMVGLKGVASYLLMNYITTLVHVPVRATSGVLGARIAAMWKENELEKIQDLYHRTSMSYLIFSLFVVSLIMFNLNFFQRLIGHNITIDLTVISLLIIVKILELSTGLANLILGYSKEWKFESIIGISYLVIAIPLNIFFVGKLGILGAAVSTLILAILTLSARLVLLYKFYGLFPFKANTLIFLSIGILLFSGFYYLCQQTDHLLVEFLWSALYVVLYIGIILRFRFSQDVNLVFDTVKKRIGEWTRILKF